MSPGSAKSMPRPSRSNPRESNWLLMYSEAVRRLSKSIMMLLLLLFLLMVWGSLRQRQLAGEIRSDMTDRDGTGRIAQSVKTEDVGGRWGG